MNSSDTLNRNAYRMKDTGTTGCADQVLAAIRRHELLRNGDTVLIGLSGGPDSVCLLLLLHRFRALFGMTLHALYVNHNLRPAEIPGEIAFCERLCREHEIPFYQESVDVSARASASGMNLQEAARELRYAAFSSVAGRIGAQRIALGHNADDQAETFLMRLIRGTGPSGLAGIPVCRGPVIRPLLETPREDIERFLAAEGVSACADSSNLKGDYLRNRLRKMIMPEVRRMNPSFLQTVRNTIDVLRDEERYFTIASTKALMRMISRKRENRIELFLSPMETLDIVILRRVLRRALAETFSLRGIGFDHIEEIIRLVRDGQAGDRIMLPREIRAIRDYAVLILTAEPPPRIDECEVMPPGEVAIRGAGLILRASLEDAPGEPADGRTAAVFDAGKMRFPLVVRPRRHGDFFLPFGFGKRKKLQDFFVDQKVPRDERDAVPIVVSGGEIVWVAGYRADERFRATDGTKKFLRLAIVKGNF